MQSIYIELFLLDNFIMNYLILRLTQTICGLANTPRTLIAAAVGGAYAALQAAGAPGLDHAVAKVALSACIVVLAFYRRGRKMLKPFAVFYAASFIAGGAVIGLAFLFGGVYMRNGIVYHVLPLRAALVGVAAVMALRWLFKRVRASWLLSRSEVRLKVTLGGRTAVLSALVDTGNAAIEPLSGKPVVIAELSKVGALIDDNMRQAVILGKLPDMEGVRAVPFHAISGKGVLPALKPDSMSIDDGSGDMKLDAYLAFCPKLAGSGAIINPAAVSTSKEGGIID
ncbi:MAG: sigma-E processing peptidase SpoIIGA [Christensenellales bacterium]